MTLTTHRDLAQKYLQSVVVLDDRLRGVSGVTEIEPTDLVEPTAEDRAAEGEDDYSDADEATAETAQDASGVEGAADDGDTDDAKDPSKDDGDDEDGAVDGFALVDQFAQLGLVCSLISPPQAQFEVKATDAIRRLANRADAFIFDWRLYGDRGRLVRQLITELVNSTGPGLARVRMIVVYTSQQNRADIRDEIAAHLRGVGIKLEAEGDPAPGADGPALLHGENFRISVLGKPQTIVGRAPRGSHVLGIDALPGWLVDEFATVTEGLLRGVALEALAALRDNTTHLLTRVGPEVDPAFVSHSYLTQTGLEFAIQLINQELETIVSSTVQAGSVDDDSLTEWVYAKFAHDKHQPYVVSGGAALVVSGDADEWLEHLRGQMVKLVKKALPTTTDRKPKLERFATVTSLFVDPSKAEEADMRMGAMSSLARTLFDPVYSTPSLHLGTVLRDDEDGYWLCLQPMCDSVRIPEGGRAFPLSPLAVVGAKDEFDLIVPVPPPESDSGSDPAPMWLRLRRKTQPHHTKMPVFLPASEGVPVCPTGDSPSEWRLKDANGVGYAWIAELRPQHGQRISNDNAGQISRVGLDESEWLRLSGANKVYKDAAPLPQ